jgi:hypothetical protein
VDVGNAGFALSQVLGFAMEVFYFVRLANMAEVECRSQRSFISNNRLLMVPPLGNSLERILDFLKIEHEPQPTKDGIPPAYWPASGSLRAEKLTARYGPGK